MKHVYCSNCGMKMLIFRKALPKFGTIIDMVDPHECSEEPLELDLKPMDIPSFEVEKKKGKFVQKLNELSPQSVRGKVGGIDSNDLGDRRFEQEKPKTTAPESLLSMLGNVQPSEPERELGEPEPEE